MAERGLFASTFDEFAFIRGILKMQMTEQSPVSEHGAFRHGLHRDEYGEGSNPSKPGQGSGHDC